MYVCVYICVARERERERESKWGIEEYENNGNSL